MATGWTIRAALAIGVAAVLSGCVEGTGPLASADRADGALPISAEGAAPAASRGTGDVEAPDVFDLRDEALWDGRPSLGGVWVAHASVKEPERVIIRNPANGKSVIGALFRRENANPGPAIQLSSDAAGALEILAGAPTEVEIVALRREEPDAVPMPGADEPESVAASPAPAAASKEEIAEAEGLELPEDETVAAAGAAAAGAAAEGAADAAAVAAGAPAAPELKPCPFWRKKKCEAERAAAGLVATPDGDAAAGAEDGQADAAASADGALPASADPIAIAAAAAIDEAEAVAPAAGADAAGTDAATAALPADGQPADAAPLAPGQKPCPFWRKKKCEAERAALAAAGASVGGGEAAAAEGAITAVEPVSADTGAIETAPLDATVPATPEAAGVLRQPYVQIGIFSQQENAQRAADQLNAAGLSASVRTEQSQGKSFWRVLVGPASSVGERDGLAARVRGMGYPDAYPVAG